MAILINPYTSISPYLYSFWFRDPVVSNHLKIAVQFIIGLCFRRIIPAEMELWGPQYRYASCITTVTTHFL